MVSNQLLSGFEEYLIHAVNDINQDFYDMARKRKLIEAAFVDGAMREVGYLFDNDGSEGPHRRTHDQSFAYHPQFVEVDDEIESPLPCWKLDA